MVKNISPNYISYKLNDSYIQATRDSYGINPTRQDVLAFMENFPTEEERIHDKPFTKLKQDTMKQLKDIVNKGI